MHKLTVILDEISFSDAEVNSSKEYKIDLSYKWREHLGLGLADKHFVDVASLTMTGLNGDKSHLNFINTEDMNDIKVYKLVYNGLH